ncbi:MAG: methyltransferase domain-containing protein [Halapricum sp.]
MTDDDDFDKSMDETDWATVYERQTEREDLVPHLCHLLDLSAGDRVLDIGCGPGYTTTRLADRVAPGFVYALDRHPEALRYLLEEADGDVEHIRPVVGDVQALPMGFSRPSATIASLVLHHVDAPERAIEAVAAAVPRDSQLLVIEYHPDAPNGPPEAHRIPASRMRQWLSGAGFRITEERDLPGGMYALVGRR